MGGEREREGGEREREGGEREREGGDKDCREREKAGKGKRIKGNRYSLYYHWTPFP